jgi:hypothetical protein
MASYEILQSLRLMAWERAKAELRSIGCADYPLQCSNSRYVEWDEKCEKRHKLIEKFIEEMEYESLI